MAVHVFKDHSIPYSWKIGPFLYSTIDSISMQIDKKFKNKNNLLIDTIWLTENNVHIKNLYDLYNKIGSIDNLFLFAHIDSINLNFKFPVGKYDIYKLGSIPNSNTDIQFDFSAISILHVFKQYEIDDLKFDMTDFKYFLCYQNKPHYHRQILTKYIIDNDLVKYGFISLGKGNFIFDDLESLEIEQNIDLKFSMTNILGSKELPYDLGDMKIWSRSFLNVVSETNSFNDLNSDFITEKSYKPIIGLRPFIINGSPNIYKRLEKNGFHTFENYWNFFDIRNAKSVEDVAHKCVTVIKYLSSLTSSEIKDMYTDMIPLLIYNRQRFFEYAKEQEHKMGNLFS